MFVWILSDTTTFYVALITSLIASPLIILLSILIIIAVLKNRALQTNANILHASMAVADLLVGAGSLPLSITVDALLLRKHLSTTICGIAFANKIVLCASICSSLYHVTVIAWERYVALTKWMQYNVIVQRHRVKTLAIIAWLLAVFTTTPVRILIIAGVPFNIYTRILNIILLLPATACMALIGYFYAKVYFGARKRQEQIQFARASSHVPWVRNWREIRIANRTLVITIVLFVYYIPSVAVLLFGEAVPFLRTSSFFRWSELLIQLSSLVNPILYCLVLNRRVRNVVLRMLGIIRKSDADQPVTRASSAAILRLHSRPTKESESRFLTLQEFLLGIRQRFQRINRPESQNCYSTMVGVVHHKGCTIYKNHPVIEKPKPMTGSCDVFTVDVDHPNSKRRKSRNKINDATKPISQNEEEDDQSLSRYNLQPDTDQSVMRSPLTTIQTQHSSRPMGARHLTWQEFLLDERQQFEGITIPESQDCSSTMVDNTHQQRRANNKANAVMETPNQVITIDVHHSDTKRRKLGKRTSDVTRRKCQRQEGDNRNLPSCDQQPEMVRPRRNSNRVAHVDVYQPKLSREKTQTSTSMVWPHKGACRHHTEDQSDQSLPKQ